MIKQVIFYLALYLAVASLFTGCKSVDRVLNGRDEDKTEDIAAINTPVAGEVPEFNLETPDRYTRVVFHGLMPATGLVSIKPDSTCLLRVFIKDQIVNQWFILGDQFSDSFWYSADKALGTVQYHGHILSQKEYCVYQYVRGA